MFARRRTDTGGRTKRTFLTTVLPLLDVLIVEVSELGAVAVDIFGETDQVSMLTEQNQIVITSSGEFVCCFRKLGFLGCCQAGVGTVRYREMLLFCCDERGSVVLGSWHLRVTWIYV